jgi:hypothetical protein
MNLAEAVSKVEAAGASFRLDGDRVRVWYPTEEQREELSGDIAFLRNHRREVAALLKARGTVPDMPPGVRLVNWNLKEPPVLIETCAVVVDPVLFAPTTLEQLRMVLAEPKRWVGWTVPQLVDRLRQVGVIIALVGF